MRKAPLALAFGLTAAAAGTGACGSSPAPALPPPIPGPEGEPARTVDFTLTDARTGQPVRLTEHRGRVVLVHFFTTGCLPCQVDIPELNALQDGPARVEALAVLGVALDLDGRRIVQPFVDVWDVRYPVLLADRTMQHGRTPFGPVTAVPASFLVDPDGRHVESFWGMVPVEYVRRRVAALAEGAR